MRSRELIEFGKKRVEDFKKLQKAGLICLDGDFFPTVHYPPITMYPSITEEGLFKEYENPKDNLFDVYAHIPFCIKHCIFCHYPVKVGDLSKEKDYYLDILKKEMAIYMRRLRLKTIHARSILVGGGTPTYLTPVQLKRFLDFFTSNIDLTNCTQFSYDVDPMTLFGREGRERLKIMKDYGVGRLTIGVQSLDDNILKEMGRPYNMKDVLKVIQECKKFGFKLNIEFIYGYPGQTIRNWIGVLRKAVSLGVEEIQLYRLKIIPYGDYSGAILKKFAKNLNDFPLIEQTITMKEIANLIFHQNGYQENLRRVFSKERKDFSHYADNQCCKLFDQIGFGLTAFSSLRDRFALNTQDFKEYYSLVEQGKLPINRGLIRDRDNQMRWCVILPLKNRELYKKLYKIQTGVSVNEVFREKIEKLKNFGLLYENANVLKLTKIGCFFADEVVQQFFHPDYIPFSRTAYARGELYPYSDFKP